MVYGYCRVSTRKQLDGNSIEEQQSKILERYPDAVIIIESYSAAKDRDIFLDLLHNKLASGDTLVCTKLDRFCRSTKEGLEYIEYLMNKGILIHIINMGLIEDTPMGKMIITNLLAYSEFERSLIIDRTQSGKAIAKTKDGYKDGRPKKFSKAQLTHALTLLKSHSYSQVEDMTGISKSTLLRAKNKNTS
jgi:DNA invertase Pin-like site-specific DNA recombinase